MQPLYHKHSLKVFNSLSRKKEAFTPIKEGYVGLYVCGPTVYSNVHLGNCRTFMSFDTIYRYLLHLGYKVRYVRNITDAGHLENDADAGEDKIAKKAKLEQIEPMEVVQKYTVDFHRTLEHFNLLPPSIEPTATGHIIEQIEIIKEILDKGFAYEVNGSVYFDVQKFNESNDYGKLSGRSIEDMVANTRALQGQSEKKNPQDFALWKKAEPTHIMRWPSPWGDGFPGWHIECTAMSTKYLGEQFDIHGGGHDLRFPHHEAEIFQSECCTGREPVVGYWMHNGFVNVDGEKMSKSLGNFWTVREAFENYTPLTLRYALLSIPYRNPIDLSPEFLEDAGIHYERLIEAYGVSLSSDSDSGADLSEASQRITDAMNDDFNSRAAIIGIQEVVSQYSGRDIATWLEQYAGEVLGLLPSSEEVLAGRAKADSARAEVTDKVEALLNEREIARQSKDWNRADEIRDELTSMDVIVEDGPDGPTWRLA